MKIYTKKQFYLKFGLYLSIPMQLLKQLEVIFWETCGTWLCLKDLSNFYIDLSLNFCKNLSQLRYQNNQ